MTLLEIARIYTELVNAENRIPESEYIAKDEVNALRTKYHQMFMDKLREEGIDFSDRFEATAIAFDLEAQNRRNFATIRAVLGSTLIKSGGGIRPREATATVRKTRMRAKA